MVGESNLSDKGPDYLGRDDLLALGLEADTVAALLALAGREVIPASELNDLLGLVAREGRQA
jgi:hypothetical protein